MVEIVRVLLHNCVDKMRMRNLDEGGGANLNVGHGALVDGHVCCGLRLEWGHRTCRELLYDSLTVRYMPHLLYIE
jgi:hypothetical protein